MDLLAAVSIAAGALLLLGLLFDAMTGAVWLTLYITQPLLNLFQRVVLGIDRIKAGPETMLDQAASVNSDFRRCGDEGFAEGTVRVDGEIWRARSDAAAEALPKGSRVIVRGRDGLVLTVSPAEENPADR